MQRIYTLRLRSSWFGTCILSRVISDLEGVGKNWFLGPPNFSTIVCDPLKLNPISKNLIPYYSISLIGFS